MIEDAKSIEVVVIDDIPESIENLKRDIADYLPHLKVVGEAHGVVSGAKLLNKCNPDIVFLDIQMNDGSGFDLLDLLSDFSFSIIFTTASDQHALKAFQYSAIDYLLKPIDPKRLIESVSRAGKMRNFSAEQFEIFKESVSVDKEEFSNIVLHTNDKISIIRIEDIIRCSADGNYTQFYLSGGERILVTKTLKAYDQLLSNHKFLRVHQSHLINLKHLKAFVKTEGGYLLMKDGSQVPVSVRKRPELMRIIEDM